MFEIYKIEYEALDTVLYHVLLNFSITLFLYLISGCQRRMVKWIMIKCTSHIVWPLIWILKCLYPALTLYLDISNIIENPNNGSPFELNTSLHQQTLVMVKFCCLYSSPSSFYYLWHLFSHPYNRKNCTNDSFIGNKHPHSKKKFRKNRYVSNPTVSPELPSNLQIK
jgi:hypothetical protein